MRPDPDFLSRLDTATVGGPSFDAAIADAYLEKRRKEQVERGEVVSYQVWITRDGAEHRMPPRFTTSLDAVLLLYDEVDLPETVPSNPLVACREAVHAREQRSLAIPRE